VFIEYKHPGGSGGGIVIYDNTTDVKFSLIHSCLFFILISLHEGMVTKLATGFRVLHPGDGSLSDVKLIVT